MNSQLKLSTLICTLAFGASGVFGEVINANTKLSIDATQSGKVLPNTVQSLTVWFLTNNAFQDFPEHPYGDIREFVRYVEVMGATGGNSQRDCFRNPSNRNIRNDYDFSRVINGCKGIVNWGAKPYLKLGNVPEKLSSKTSGGDFSMNIRPPDDWQEYSNYMQECAKALLNAFGRDELLKWRFAVLTEYENGGWFKDASGNPEKTFQAYCRLYEVTVKAFTSVIGDGLTFGVHAMAVTEGLWDERRIFKFIADKKLPISFATTSFYDFKAGRFTSGLTLPNCIKHLRTAAESAGLTNLYYAVDEGRILDGEKGGVAKDLALRIVGDTYQAAYDARITKQLFDSDAQYFSAWGYHSGNPQRFDGAPSVSFYVAQAVAKFEGMQRLTVTTNHKVNNNNLEIDAIAGLSKDQKTLRIVAYAFTNTLHCAITTPIKLQIKTPSSWKQKQVCITSYMIDDNCNWFDEWREDRKRFGFTNDHYIWSPDDPAVCVNGLRTPEDRNVFISNLPKYQKCAELKPTTTCATITNNGTCNLEATLQANAVWCVEIK